MKLHPASRGESHQAVGNWTPPYGKLPGSTLGSSSLSAFSSYLSGTALQGGGWSVQAGMPGPSPSHHGSGKSEDVLSLLRGVLPLLVRPFGLTRSPC